MKRLAIIISAPGGYDYRTKRLEGIENDVNNWINFLSSNIGGAWEQSDNEIIAINNPTPDDIIRLHDLVNISDYNFILLAFSGHGGYDEKTKTNAYFIDNEVIPEKEFLLNVEKQLLIFDACRKPEPNIFNLECFSAESTELIKSFSRLREREIREQYKRMYNAAILRLPPMEERIYSCSVGETAGDIGTGGLFTLNLINAVKDISNEKNGIISTSQAFIQAKNETINMRRHQTPTCILSRTPFPMGISLSPGI